MAQDVISTLFGITPRNAAFDQYAQERMIDVNKAGSQYADLGRANIERASAMMQNAGTGLGIGIGRLLGGQTPQMAEEQRVQGMLGGASLQDPEQLMMAAERFAQAGDIPRAQALAGQAQALKTRQEEQERAKETQQADLLKKQADADKVRYEMEMKQVAYQNRFRALKAKFKDIPDEVAQALALSETSFNEAIKAPKANTQFVTSGGRVVLRDKDTGAEILDVGAAPDGRQVTTVNLGGPDTTVKAFEVADADALKNLRTAASAASGQLGFIAQARDQAGAVSGSGIPTIVRGLNTFLSPLGINTEQVAKTRNLEQALNSIIAQGIKQYGANPSTADLEFAKRASASITDPKQAIAETLNYLEARAQALIDKSTAADTYLLTNKNLGGFEQFWSNQQRNKNNPSTQSGVRKTKSGVSYTVSPAK